jgi:hypothetical protein
VDVVHCTFQGNDANAGSGGNGGSGGFGGPSGSAGSAGSVGNSEGGGFFSQDNEDNGTGSITSIINSIFTDNSITQGTGFDIRTEANSDLEDLLNNAIESTTGYVVDNNNTGNVTWNGTGYTTILADNGGPTQTISILESFNGVNAGTTFSSPNIDQRSYPRDENPDIGAYEFGAAINSQPQIYSINITEISINSASYSANVFDGSASTTITFEYGFNSRNYSTTTTSQVIDGNSATVNVGINETGLESGTFYYAVARAENSVSYNYSDETSFWTLTEEPNAHSTTFWQSGEENTSLELKFDAFSGITNATGYLIIRSNSAFGENDYPNNSGTYNVNDTFGNSTVVANITDGSTTSYTFNNLSMEKSWQFALIPYNIVANEATAHYKTDNAPTVQGYTIPTLGEWGMIAFGSLMLLGGLWYIRRVV